VSGPGILFLANNFGNTINNTSRQALNTRFNINIPAGTTLGEFVRHLLRRMPRRFRQAPIDSDGWIRVRVGDHVNEFNQDDDVAQCLDPPEADSYPPRGS
jgi:hypothetical protein